VKCIRHILLILCFTGFSAKSQLTFPGLDSLFKYADKNSSVSKTSTQQSLLAKWTKVAALANTINFKSPVTFSATDNLKLPVNFLPAEAFGGPAGIFREITLGQEYVSNFNFNPQIDIVNPYNWARVKSASISKELTEVTNQVNKKTLYENIAAAYYNITALQEQIIITEKSLAASDSILFIVKNKFDQGIVREQDVNNASANKLNVADKLEQLKSLLNQQLNTLKILCDIPSGTQVTVKMNGQEDISGSVKSTSTLQSRLNTLQSSYARNELRANRMSMLPTLSLFYYQGWQQNSNTSFFDNKASWIQSQFIGIRITVPIPPDVNKLSQTYTSKINYRIAELNNSHTQLQTEMANRNMEIDYDKASSTYLTAKKIFELRNSNYIKSMNQYREGILPTDNLLAAFNDLLSSELNVIAAYSSANFNRSKIAINNSIR
jgi:outer membrane protein